MKALKQLNSFPLPMLWNMQVAAWQEPVLQKRQKLAHLNLVKGKKVSKWTSLKTKLILGLKILHSVHKAMGYYCSRVKSCVELPCLQHQSGTAGDLLWLQGQCATKREKQALKSFLITAMPGGRNIGNLDCGTHSKRLWTWPGTEGVGDWNSCDTTVLLKDPSLSYQWRNYCVNCYCSRLMCHWRR